ncbi:MAG: hypothetical protein AAB213_00715 [Candidatus Omnitrophota bacterium]
MFFKRIVVLFILVALYLANFAPRAFADRRSYVWTYEYMTMLKGRFELEYYLTNKVPDTDRSGINTFEHWLELEYGITERWDVAVYQQFKHANKAKESDFSYDGFKIRTRYRLGEKGQYLLDPLIYLEYIRSSDLSKPNMIEAKLILAKDIGKFNFAYNQILKQEAERDGLTDHEYAIALGYRLMPKFGIGLESKGNYTKDKYALGPTVSYRGKGWFSALGAAFGLNDRTNDIETRMIIGILF